MLMLGVQTGILFLILCGVSSLPYGEKKLRNGNLDFNEVRQLLDRQKRTPHDSFEGHYHHGGSDPVGEFLYSIFHPKYKNMHAQGHFQRHYGYPGYHRGFGFGRYGHHHGHPHFDTSFEHNPEWHRDHPYIGHDDHHHCDHHYNHGYPRKPVGDHHHPVGTNTNVDNTYIKPVSEPNLDIDVNNGSFMEKTSTPNPAIDVRSGV